jgi:hypothetical protein
MEPNAAKKYQMIVAQRRREGGVASSGKASNAIRGYNLRAKKSFQTLRRQQTFGAFAT